MTRDPQVAAVRKALYEPNRLRRLKDDLHDIAMFMNLDPTIPLQPADIRVHAGSGPRWFYADGRLSVSVLDAAGRCDKVAGALRAMSRDVAGVRFDPKEKQLLRTALEEHASVWAKRGGLWRAPTDPGAEPLLAEIETHNRKSLRAYAQVHRYLKAFGPL